MSTNIIRIKRRLAVDGAAAPTTSQLVNAELAFSELDETLYYGKGGDETASAEVIKIGGAGLINSTVSAVSAGIDTRLTAIENLTAASGTGSEGDFVMLGAGGKISDTYLPALAITTTHVVTAFADSSTLTVQEGDVLVVNDEDTGMLSKSFIYNASGQWIELKTPLDAKIDALSADLQGAINDLQTSGVDAVQGELDTLSSAFETLTAGNETGGSVSVLGSIASQNSDAVNITGGTVTVSALEVTQGTAKFAGISASGNVDIAGGLTVSQGVGLSSTLTVGGKTTITSGGLDVTGDTIVDGLTASAAVELQSGLDVTGSTTVDGLTASAAVELQSGLDVTGSTTVDGLTASAAVELQSGLDVTGSTTVDGLTASAAVELQSTVNMTGPVTISGNLSGASVYNLSGYNCYFDAGTY